MTVRIHYKEGGDLTILGVERLDYSVPGLLIVTHNNGLKEEITKEHVALVETLN